MDIKVDVAGLQKAVERIMDDYGDVIYKATEDSIDAAADVLVTNLKAESPKKTGKFARAWKSTGKQYKLLRFVGNSTTVKTKKGETALSNILEYSQKHGKPFIAQTSNSSLNEMAAAFIAAIKNRV